MKNRDEHKDRDRGPHNRSWQRADPSVSSTRKTYGALRAWRLIYMRMETGNMTWQEARPAIWLHAMDWKLDNRPMHIDERGWIKSQAASVHFRLGKPAQREEHVYVAKALPLQSRGFQEANAKYEAKVCKGSIKSC